MLIACVATSGQSSVASRATPRLWINIKRSARIHRGSIAHAIIGWVMLSTKPVDSGTSGTTVWQIHYSYQTFSRLFFRSTHCSIRVNIFYFSGIAQREAEPAREAEKAREEERAREQRRRVPAFLNSQPRRIPLRPTPTVVHDTPPNSPVFPPASPHHPDLHPSQPGFWFLSLILYRTHFSQMHRFTDSVLYVILNSLHHYPSKLFVNSFFFLYPYSEYAHVSFLLCSTFFHIPGLCLN